MAAGSNGLAGVALAPACMTVWLFAQISLTERLFVVSVSVSDVNLTVIGGLHDGENVAVAMSV